MTRTPRRQAPVHPGEILAAKFLTPLGLTPYRVAVDCGVRPPRFYEIVRGKRSLTADTALRLGRYFGMIEALRGSTLTWRARRAPSAGAR